MFTSARDVTCISHNTCLHQPQRRPILGPASATHLYTSATIPVYVGQNCDLHRPQYLATSATTSVYVGQHWDLRRPHNCPGHWPVAFPDSRGPGNLTGSAQCAGPGNGSSRHSVMALCAFTAVCDARVDFRGRFSTEGSSEEDNSDCASVSSDDSAIETTANLVK